MKYNKIDIDLITVPERYNSKAIVNSQLEAITDILSLFGQTYPLKVNKNYELLDGFYLLAAARSLNLKEVKVVIVDDNAKVEDVEKRSSPTELSALEFANQLKQDFYRYINFSYEEEDPIMEFIPEFAEYAAQSMELSPQQIMELTKASILIDQKEQAIITRLGLDSNQSLLLEIADLSEPDQRETLMSYDEEYIISMINRHNEAC